MLVAVPEWTEQEINGNQFPISIRNLCPSNIISNWNWMRPLAPTRLTTSTIIVNYFVIRNYSIIQIEQCNLTILCLVIRGIDMKLIWLDFETTHSIMWCVCVSNYWALSKSNELKPTHKPSNSLCCSLEQRHLSTFTKNQINISANLFVIERTLSWTNEQMGERGRKK